MSCVFGHYFLFRYWNEYLMTLDELVNESKVVCVGFVRHHPSTSHHLKLSIQQHPNENQITNGVIRCRVDWDGLWYCPNE